VKEAAYIGETTKLPFLHCPACGKRIDAATGVSLDDEPARPRSGSFTVCLYCATLLIFEESFASVCPLRLRRASASEVEAVKQRDPHLAALLAKIQQAAHKLVRSEKRRRQG
jgi:nitrite reductase/ring-hydroxylating ferredoxin subunit